MQSHFDVEASPHTSEGIHQPTQHDSVYQIIYVRNNDEQVKVIETPTIQFEHMLTWLQMGNSIFITQKPRDLE
jgi:hypothetical protein